MRIRICLLFLSAWLAAGCASNNVSGQLPSYPAAGKHPAPTISAQLPKGNQPVLTLNDCIKTALQNHPALKIYQSRISQKSESYNAAQASALPVLSLSTSYDRLSYVSPVKKQFLGDSNNDYQANINIEAPLFTGGRISAEKDQAVYALNGSREDYRGAELEVTYRVKSAYYKLMAAEDVVAIRRDLLDRLNSFWATAKELNQRTKMPREEVLLRIEVQVNTAQQELINAQTNVKILKELLINAMGLPGSPQAEALVISHELSDNSTQGSVGLNIQNNPDLLKLDQELKRAASALEAAQGEYYPQLKLRGSYGYEWATLPPERDTWSFGLVMTLPLWDWGRIKSKVKQAESYLDEISATKELTGQRISLEAKTAYLDGQSSRQRVAIARESLDKASKSLELFEQRYKDNTATSLEILDAWQSYSLTRLNQAQSILDLRLSQAALEKLTVR